MSSSGAWRSVAAWAVGIILIGCAAEETLEKPPLPVRLQEVRPAGRDRGVRYSANIEPRTQVMVAFKVSGYVQELLKVPGVDGRPRDVQGGDRVAKGTVLARVRETDYAQSVHQARSQLAEAEATRDRARQDFERAQALLATQSLTQPEYDSAKASHDVAQARVEGARAQLEVAQAALDDCALKAPIDGVVLDTSIKAGELVAPGTVGFVVADTTAVKAVFGVSDVMLADLKAGAPLSVRTEAIQGTDFRGRITRISPSADPKSRVFEVELTIPNPDDRLKAGMVASLQVDEGGGNTAAGEGAARAGGAASGRVSGDDTTPAVLLSAVVRPADHPEGYAVFVVEDPGGTPVARLRRVELGDAIGNSIVVTEGLKVGERVVVTGATLLSDGQAIRIVP